jgi:hypothetical protein
MISNMTSGEMKMNDMHNPLDGMADERVTIIVPSLSQAAFEVHRQNMWERGYRLENKINSQKYFASDGYEITHLFEGKTMYAATFVKRH